MHTIQVAIEHMLYADADTRLMLTNFALVYLLAVSLALTSEHQGAAQGGVLLTLRLET